MKQYDVVIIGAGPGGYVAAIEASHLGLQVAIVEKEFIGGVCLNIGCIPTKTLLKSANVFKTIKEANDFGIQVPQDQIGYDWKKVLARKDSVVKKLTDGVKLLLDKNKIDTYQGYGEVKSAKEVVVNGQTLKTKNVILATGASPVLPPIPGVKEAYEKGILVTSKEMLSIPSVPKELIIVGGGVIGIEFATIFSSFQTKVTIIEKAENILLNVDDEVRSAYLRILKKQKIQVITNAAVIGIQDHEVTYMLNNQEMKVHGDAILMSVGMRPNSKGLEQLQLKMKGSAIEVNENMETSQKGIYAIGDLNGNMMLAHVASKEGMVAVHHIANDPQKIDYGRIPSGIYGFPEIGMIGLTEQEAKAKGVAYQVSKFPLAANGKALSEKESDGFIKIIADTKYKEIIGVHILGIHATDLISEALMTMELEGTAFEMAHAVHPHPTLSEMMMEAAHGIIAKPIHII